MGNRKIIGIPCWLDKERVGCGVSYMEYFQQYGDVRLIMPYEILAEDIDLLVMTGGPDASVAGYHNDDYPGYYTSNSCQFREFFAAKRLKNYIGVKSILGICLGMQYINLHFNGGLDQNIYHEVDKDSCHPIYDMNMQPLMEKIGKKEYPILVNSSHHQGVPRNLLGNELIPICQSAEGYIECFKHETLPIVGTQFHVERANNYIAHELIKELLNK